MTDEAMPPPGWYDNPGKSPGYRYWDGEEWTNAISEKPQVRAPTAIPAPPTQSKKTRKGWKYAGIAFGVTVALSVVLGSLGLLDEESPTTEATTSPTSAEATTTRRPTTSQAPTARDLFEGCVSGWDGNWEELEAEIRDVLNDPGSMETLGTYFNASDDLSNGSITVRLEYTAKNAFGGRVRHEAWAEMDKNCAVKEVIAYG